MLQTGEMRVILRDSALDKRVTCETLSTEGDDGARKRIPLRDAWWLSHPTLILCDSLQNRSAFRKKKPDMGFEEMQLRGALRAVAVKHPAWGWRKSRWHLLAQPEWDGVELNRKRVRRLWRDEGLVCKPRVRKQRRTGPGAGEQKRLTAQYPLHVVSFDFQSDVISCGRHIRFLNVIDEYTRTALAIIPRRSFKASDVVAVMENIIAETGAAPAYVRCDNGPEFTAATLIDLCNTAGVDTAFIDPG